MIRIFSLSPMQSFRVVVTTVLLLRLTQGAATTETTGTTETDVRPSIVFILADDLGYNEMGFMNSSRGIHTPHLDTLAKEGVILKNYYVQPICSPTRSAFMTGRVPLQLGTQSNVIFHDTPWAIDVSETFLPQNLQDAGYDTAMFGKWHLGMFRRSAWPRSRGFDEHMGYLQGCQSKGTHTAACCAPGNATSGDLHYTCTPTGHKDFRGYDWFKSAGGQSLPDTSANGTSSAKLIGNAAVEYIWRKAFSSQKPFFLYLPFQNIHDPYSVEPRFREIYSHVSGITDEEVTMWGYISEMDEQVGRVVDALKDSGMYNKTIIFFSSDNGAPPALGVSHEEQLMPGLTPAWSRRNFPFRGYKTTLWEGGTRVPGFVHSPLLPAKVQGTVSEALLHITDWLPTIVGLAGGNTKRNRALDGFNVWPAILGGPNPRQEVLYNVNPLCYSGQAGAPKAGIRIGDWKLLTWCYSISGIDGANVTGPTGSSPGEFQNGVALFDLATDPRETSNVAAWHPKVVKALLARLAQWAEKSVEPMQWTAPYQGKDYFCKDCPLHPSRHHDPSIPWTDWIKDNTTDLVDGFRETFPDHMSVVV